MSEKFSIIKTFRNENTEGKKVYLNIYQVIRDNTKNRYMVGFSLKNDSEKNIESLNLDVSYIENNKSITDKFHFNFKGENKGKLISHNFYIEKKKIENIDILPGSVNFVPDIHMDIPVLKNDNENQSETNGSLREVPIPTDDENDIAVLEIAKEKKKSNKKGVFAIVASVVFIVCVVAGFLLLFPGESKNDGKGINKVTGKGNENITLEEPTDSPENITLSVDIVPAVKEQGVNKVSVGKVLKQDAPQILKSFLNGRFYLKGKMYEQSNNRTEDIILALNGSDYYYSKKVGNQNLVQCKIKGADYFIDPVNKSFITVTTTVMNALGKTPDDFNLKIFNQTIRNSYVLREAVINSQKGLFMRVNYIDGFYDDLYVLNGKVVQINAFNNAGILTQSFVPQEFKGDIPTELTDLSLFTANKDYSSFFKPYVN